MLTDSDLKKIETLLDQKLEEKLDKKLDQKLAKYASKDYLLGALDATFDVKLEPYITKEYFKEQIQNYPTKEDLKNELENYATKEDLQTSLQKMQDTIISQINIIIEIVGEQNEKIDLVKNTTNNHEYRISTLEKHKMN